MKFGSGLRFMRIRPGVLVLLSTLLLLWPKSGLAIDEPTSMSTSDATVAAGNTEVLPILGRVKETTSPDSTLPESLTVLRAQTAKLDNRPIEPLKAGVEFNNADSNPSFPSYIDGGWGGQVHVVSFYLAPHTRITPRFELGTTGLVVFHFSQVGSTVQLQPATVFFPGGNKKLSKLLKRSPTIAFGDTHQGKLNGQEVQVEVTENNVRILDDITVEQDIVTKRKAALANGPLQLTYDESVLQFRRTVDDKQYVRAAKIIYGTDRRILQRTVVEGRLSRNWETIAKQIGEPVEQHSDAPGSHFDR